MLEAFTVIPAKVERCRALALPGTVSGLRQRFDRTG